MDIRDITPTYSVSPRIGPNNVPALANAGFSTLISNLPDAETYPGTQSEDMAKACEAAGIRFVYNPVRGGELTFETMETQKEEGLNAEGRTIAYCASGTRSAVLWAILQAGQQPVDAILSATAGAGYNLEGLRRQLDAMAKR